MSNTPPSDEMTVGRDKAALDFRVSSKDLTFWKDRPVLVTGGSGLLGGWLVRRLLRARACLVCLVRERLPRPGVVAPDLLQQAKLVHGEIRDQMLLERTLKDNQIDTVFHVAAQAIVGIANRNPVATFETNVQGTWCLLEACRQNPGVRQIIVSSSDKAYGEHTEMPYCEDMALAGLHPYEVSKACADRIATSYGKSYGLPVSITRCGNYFGGGDLNWNRIVPGTIRAICKGERPLIRSDGQFIRDYLYADDGAAAHMHLARALSEDRSLAGEAFNFSHEVRMTVVELVEKIAQLMGSSLTPDIRNEVSQEIRTQFLTSAKARERLGWKPLYTMEEGLRETVHWYRDYLSNTDGQEPKTGLASPKALGVSYSTSDNSGQTG
jgi:CDP-glucose 4,6-dehydratase